MVVRYVLPWFFLVLATSCMQNSKDAQAETVHTCGKETVDEIPFSWCIDRPQGKIDDRNTIVFLHGLGGSEQSWSQTPFAAMLQTLTLPQRPTVLSISLGPIWLLAQPPASQSLYAKFIASVLPAAQAHLLTPAPGLILVGESMGGFNAAQILAGDPSLFRKVALLCPALSVLGPFADSDAIQNFLTAHPETDPQKFALEQTIAQQTFKTEAGYTPSAPATLLTKISAMSPPVFISAGDRDEFGFYPATAQFALTAAQQGANVHFVSIDSGKHCQQTSASLQALRDFLIESPNEPRTQGAK